MIKNFLLMIPIDGNHSKPINFYAIRTTHEEACKQAMILVNHPMTEEDLPGEDFYEWLGIASVLEVGESDLVKEDHKAYLINSNPKFHGEGIEEVERLLNTANKEDLIESLLNSCNIL
jgi:hypothetical protein